MTQKTILVIDDETEILELMEGWLSHVGYRVLTASNGEDGLWKLKSDKPDVLILDMLIPGLSGTQVLEKIKTQSEQIRNIPIIMMSARESMQDLSGDVFAFVLKPFEPKELLALIKKALGEQEA